MDKSFFVFLLKHEEVKVLDPVTTQVLEQCDIPGQGKFLALSNCEIRIAFTDRTCLDMTYDFSNRLTNNHQEQQVSEVGTWQLLTFVLIPQRILPFVDFFGYFICWFFSFPCNICVTTMSYVCLIRELDNFMLCRNLGLLMFEWAFFVKRFLNTAWNDHAKHFYCALDSIERCSSWKPEFKDGKIIVAQWSVSDGWHTTGRNLSQV